MYVRTPLPRDSYCTVIVVLVVRALSSMDKFYFTVPRERGEPGTVLGLFSFPFESGMLGFPPWEYGVPRSVTNSPSYTLSETVDGSDKWQLSFREYVR